MYRLINSYTGPLRYGACPLLTSYREHSWDLVKRSLLRMYCRARESPVRLKSQKHLIKTKGRTKKMTNQSETPDKLTLINELARRRGFYWQSYEIYGGVSGFTTYGFLGAKLKQNIENKLRKLFVNKLGIQEIESPIIAPSQVFEASGHVAHFREPLVECQKCKKKFRADHILRECSQISEVEAEKMCLEELQKAIEEHEAHCPECGGTFGEPKQFFTMFTTTIGPYSDAVGYGRPEAAQGIFVEFNRLYSMARERLVSSNIIRS